ncbi:MAG TPA: DUF3043 domain-containing protein [Streptosporangiaceae bacterium]|nr:DUF3043 domain-containing protein [Streptosporangiaceae bacterium]
MFRRRTPSEPAGPDQLATPGQPQSDQSKGTPSKGRPTPKRSEAEKRRRQPITAPKSRKEAYRRQRERVAQDRAKARAGLARGDDKYLPKRDRGPVRRLARDYVDARRTLGSYLMWILLASLMLNVVPIVLFRLISFFIPPLLLVIVLVEGVVISRKVGRLAAERYPDEDRRGVGFYAAMRAMQIRRWRIPQPQVKVGDQIGE